MMKPSWYDEVTDKVTDKVEKMEAGVYVCTILKVERTISSTNKDMLCVFLDILEGSKKGFYKEKFDNAYQSPYQDKKWGCIVYLVVDESNSFLKRRFKNFITAFESYNKAVVWTDEFVGQFKGKKIAVIFSEEEWNNRFKGIVSVSVKPHSFVTKEDLKTGNYKIPTLKKLKESIVPTVVNNDDDDLPF